MPQHGACVARRKFCSVTRASYHVRIGWLFRLRVSLVLFVLALREIGAARTGAYFSTAPFIGAIVARSCCANR